MWASAFEMAGGMTTHSASTTDKMRLHSWQWLHNFHSHFTDLTDCRKGLCFIIFISCYLPRVLGTPSVFEIKYSMISLLSNRPSDAKGYGCSREAVHVPSYPLLLLTVLLRTLFLLPSSPHARFPESNRGIFV
jgi:hypothetical protein